MKSAITLLSFALALGTPAFAQKMGGTNHNAPMLTQTFTSDDKSVDFVVEYTAITWADGQFMTRVMDKENGGRVREHVNRVAPTQPLGSLRADSPLQIGGTNVPKGMYALYFTIGEDLVWSVNLQNEKDESMVFSWKLSLDTVKKKHSRLRVLLAPAESARNAELEVSFGNMQGALEVARGSEKKAESQPSKTTESN
ncbi:MAG: DUF2911 domain-containing protein [Planctomycetes bacterium]|nr:DUF2911 domain-containing protein [Planctomycetota bacterium]